MTPLTSQFSSGSIHSIPTDDVCREVASYMREKRRRVTLDDLSITLSLSAIGDGLRLIENGRISSGVRLIRHGADYLRTKVDEVHESGAQAPRVIGHQGSGD